MPRTASEALEHAYQAWWDELLRGLIAQGVLTEAEGDAAELRFSSSTALRPKPRNYAATHTHLVGPAGPVEIHRDAVRELDDDQAIAILAHELGHVIDLSRYGRQHRRDRGVPADEEQRADWWAAKMLGAQIRYHPETMVQTLDASGIKRPRGLR